jgi:methionyl-tRNA formyltransferase
MLGQVAVDIGPRETAGELEVRLAESSPSLLLRVIDEMESGATRPVPQSESEVTLAPKLLKEQGLIDWTVPTREIDRHVRAMQPWPQPFSFLHTPGREPMRLLVLAVAPIELPATEWSESQQLAPGDVLTARRDTLLVRTGDGVARIERLQPSGKKPMTDAEFLRGHALSAGWRFGAESQ